MAGREAAQTFGNGLKSLLALPYIPCDVCRQTLLGAARDGPNQRISRGWEVAAEPSNKANMLAEAAIVLYRALASVNPGTVTRLYH